MLATLAIKNGASRAKPLPQRLLTRAINSRCGLPLFEKGGKSLTRDLPLLGRAESLGLDHDGLSCRQRCLSLASASSLSLCSSSGEKCIDVVARTVELDHIAEKCWAGQGLAGVSHRTGCRIEAASFSQTTSCQLNLNEEVVILATEEGEPLIRSAGRPLPHADVAVGTVQPHRASFVNEAEASRVGAAHRRRRGRWTT